MFSITAARIMHVESVMIPYWLMNVKLETKFSAEVRYQNATVKPKTGVRACEYQNQLRCALDDNVSTYHIIRQMDGEWDYQFAVCLDLLRFALKLTKWRFY